MYDLIRFRFVFVKNRVISAQNRQEKKLKIFDPSQRCGTWAKTSPARKPKNPKGSLKELIKSAVEEYGDEMTNRFYAEKIGTDHTILSREPCMTHLEEAKKEYRKQRTFEKQRKVQINEKQVD